MLKTVIVLLCFLYIPSVSGGWGINAFHELISSFVSVGLIDFQAPGLELG